MGQQTLIVTFYGASAIDTSQSAIELGEFLQAAFQGTSIVITHEKSKDYTQNLWDRIIAILNAKSVPVFLANIATFLKRKPLQSTNFTIEIREGKTILLKAENLTDENFQHTLNLWTPLIKEMVDKTK